MIYFIKKRNYSQKTDKLDHLVYEKNKEYRQKYVRKKILTIFLEYLDVFVPARYCSFFKIKKSIILNTASPLFKTTRGHALFIHKKSWFDVINRYQNQAYEINTKAIQAFIQSSFFINFQNNKNKLFYSKFKSFFFIFLSFVNKQPNFGFSLFYNHKIFKRFLVKYTRVRFVKWLLISNELTFLKKFSNKKKRIFHSLNLDFRGRIVVKNRFNFLSSKLIRSCIQFTYTNNKIKSKVDVLTSSGWKYVFLSFLGLRFPKHFENNLIYFIECLDFYGVPKKVKLSGDSNLNKSTFLDFFNISFKKPLMDITKKELFLYISTLAREEKDFIISLDASGCIIQILGVIIGSLFFINASNVVATQQNIIVDPYQAIIIKALENSLVSTSLSDGDRKNVIILLDILKAKNFSNNIFRQALKMYIITFMFNSSSKNRNIAFIKNMQGVQLSEKITTQQTSQLLSIVLDKHFPELELIRKFIFFIYSRGKQQEFHGRPSVETSEKTVITDYSCINEVKANHFSMPIRDEIGSIDAKHGRSRPVIYIPEFDTLEYKFRKRKSFNAFMPHFLHSLESQLFFSVLERVNCKIPVCGVHDCFIVHPNFAEPVILAYKKALVDLFESFSSERALFFKNRPRLRSQFKKDFEDTLKKIAQIDSTYKKVNVSTLSQEEIENFIKEWIIASEYPLSPF